MIERPILFSAPMVRAILAGRKTQTRRVVKPQPIEVWDGGKIRVYSDADFKKSWHQWPGAGGNWDQYRDCRHLGAPGSRLWVRESIYWLQDQVAYTADNSVHPTANWPWEGRTSLPSIFMPRRLSRLTLEVVSIHVERLQDIRAEGAIAEGVSCLDCWEPLPCQCQHPDPVEAYRRLWDVINAHRPGCAWADNPWVWVVAFKRVEVSR